MQRGGDTWDGAGRSASSEAVVVIGSLILLKNKGGQTFSMKGWIVMALWGTHCLCCIFFFSFFILIYIFLIYNLYLFPAAAVTKYHVTKSHKLGGLKQQKFILAQFWRPEVWNQDVGRTMRLPNTLGKNPSLPLPASGGVSKPWLVAASLQSLLCHHMASPPLCMSVSQSTSSYKVTVIGCRAQTPPV